MPGTTFTRKRTAPSIEPLESRRLLTTLPAQFVVEPVTNPIPFASTFAVAPDGKLFVVQQDGVVQVYADHTSGPAGLLQANFFRDTGPSVNFAGERGMFGIVFDPGYLTNRYMYVHYTFNMPPFPNRISRFTANADGDLAVPGSHVLLMEMEPSTALNHNGGAMHFGPDGKLYVALGDNGVPGNAQSIESLKGKILRINATPGDLVPDDNPTTIDGIPGTPTGIHRAIWAAGLRNPYTFAFQPGTGRMFINDVGEVTWEEINDAAPGRNFGWPLTEGDFDPAQFPDFTRPLFAYHHTTGDVVGQAIVGGAFYNPPAQMFPADYVGDYFFGDFSAGWIKRIDPQTKAVNDFLDGAVNITGLAVAPDGSLLYSTYQNGVFRVIFDDEPPMVTDSVFDFDGVTLPDPPHRLRFSFSEDVSASLTTDDLHLVNLTSGQAVPASATAIEWDAPTHTATFTFPGFADGILPDGNYRATLLAAGITDPAGNPLEHDHVLDFRFLMADANNDGAVNLADFNILAANFGQSPRTFSQGDFNYDGVVNLADFNILASRFGAVLGSVGFMPDGRPGDRLADDSSDDDEPPILLTQPANFDWRAALLSLCYCRYSHFSAEENPLS